MITQTTYIMTGFEILRGFDRQIDFKWQDLIAANRFQILTRFSQVLPHGWHPILNTHGLTADMDIQGDFSDFLKVRFEVNNLEYFPFFRKYWSQVVKNTVGEQKMHILVVGLCICVCWRFWSEKSGKHRIFVYTKIAHSST